MVTEYLFYVKSIVDFALIFFGFIILVLASVSSICQDFLDKEKMDKHTSHIQTVSLGPPNLFFDTMVAKFIIKSKFYFEFFSAMSLPLALLRVEISSLFCLYLKFCQIAAV